MARGKMNLFIMKSIKGMSFEYVSCFSFSFIDDFN